MKIIKNIVLSASEPSDINVVWAKPEGDGNIKLNIFNGKAWTTLNVATLNYGDTVEHFKELDNTDSQFSQSLEDLKTKINSLTDELSQLKGTEIGDLKTQISDLKNTLSGKQDTLVSGTNIKTINRESILGGGDLTVTAKASDNGGSATK